VSRWETTATLDTDAAPAAVWERAYADAAAWPLWNRELKRATLDGSLAEGAEARIVFRTGLRLRFRVVEPTATGGRLSDGVAGVTKSWPRFRSL